MAKIRNGGTYEYLGYYSDQEEAARAWDYTARLLRGDDGNCNFPPSTPPSGLIPILQRQGVL